MIQIVDNFLDIKDFENIKNIVNHLKFPWEIISQANKNSSDERHFQLMHSLHYYPYRQSKHLDNIMKPLAKKIKIHFDVKKINLVRARVNCFFRQNEQLEYGYHKDINNNDNLINCLFYLDTNNGYTEFKTGEKVKTVENRILFFSNTLWHQTVSQTDSLFRKNLNLNFEI